MPMDGTWIELELNSSWTRVELGLNSDWTRVELRLNSDWTWFNPSSMRVQSGFNPSLTWDPSKFNPSSTWVLSEFNPGSIHGHEIFGLWDVNQVNSSSIWGQWVVYWTSIRLQWTCNGQSMISHGIGCSVSQCSLHGRNKFFFWKWGSLGSILCHKKFDLDTPI